MVTLAPKNIIISSFRKAPRGFIVLAALFLATEAFLNVMRPYVVSRFWNKFIINEPVLLDLPRDFDYLIMGDSIQKSGIEVNKISDDILNLGLPGAKPASMYLLFKRYLKSHKPPKAVFLFLDPQEPHQAMNLILKYFVTWPEYISLWRDLTWDERGHFLLKYWVSLDERIVTDPLGMFYGRSNKSFREELIRNHGYMPLPNQGRSIKDDHFATTGERPEKSISITKQDLVYLDKLIRLARSNNVKIALMGELLPKELHDRAEKTGFNLQWVALLDVILKKYPDVELAKEPIMYLDNKYFCDMSHVNTEGRAIYTRYFKDKVFILYADKNL